MTDAECREARERFAAGGVTQVRLCAEYDVSAPYMSRVLRGVSRADAGGPFAANYRADAVRTEADFWERVDVRGPDDCWVWMERVDGGYPRQVAWGRRKRGHVASWEMANGRAVAPGLQVNHWCGNKRCVNPLHLYEGTQRQNVQDAIRLGEAPVGERNGGSFTDAQVAEMRRAYRLNEVSVDDLVEQTGELASIVRNALSGRTYKHLPGAVELPSAKKLDPDKVRYARREFDAKRKTKTQLAKQFNVDLAVMSRAIDGISWKGVE